MSQGGKMSPTTTMGGRALNRATLARQLLLDRVALPVPAAVEQLAGMQAQHPTSWYVGLWSRLAGFDPVAAGGLLTARELVRVPVMRSTVHLVTAADALALRPLTDVPIERSTLGQFGRHLVGVDRTALVAAARALVEDRPLMASELGRALATTFPGRDPGALAQAARAWLPMVQVPPRGVWGRAGRPLQAPLDTWLGAPCAAMPVERLVLRYLAAFGPATVRDAQTWSGLTRLGEVVDRLRPSLEVVAGAAGGELFDLPGAPRPGEDVPAPVRFLYDYDNLLLSHADRARVLGGPAAQVGAAYAAHGYTAESNLQPASLLVDGVVAGTWRVTRSAGRAVLAVRGFAPFSGAVGAEIEAEGAALLAFLHPRDTPEIRRT